MRSLRWVIRRRQCSKDELDYASSGTPWGYDSSRRRSRLKAKRKSIKETERRIRQMATKLEEDGNTHRTNDRTGRLSKVEPVSSGITQEVTPSGPLSEKKTTNEVGSRCRTRDGVE